MAVFENVIESELSSHGHKCVSADSIRTRNHVHISYDYNIYSLNASIFAIFYFPPHEMKPATSQLMHQVHVRYAE